MGFEASGCERKQKRKGEQSGAALVACLSMEQYHNWLLQSTLGGRQKKKQLVPNIWVVVRKRT